MDNNDLKWEIVSNSNSVIDDDLGKNILFGKYTLYNTTHRAKIIKGWLYRHTIQYMPEIHAPTVSMVFVKDEGD